VHSLPLGFASAPTHAVSSTRRRVIAAAAAVRAAAVVALLWVGRIRLLLARRARIALGTATQCRRLNPGFSARPSLSHLASAQPADHHARLGRMGVGVTPPRQHQRCLGARPCIRHPPAQTHRQSRARRACQLGGACLSVGRGVLVSWARPFLSLAHLPSAGGLSVSPPPSSTSGRIPSSVPPAGWAASARAGC
jgi:hypothetical protein